MIGSYFSGVSGLKDHLLWLDVIGENLANVDTTGFKKSRVTFEDILNQNLESAVAPGSEVGGINPTQIGLGSTLAVVQVMHTQGKILGTGRNTDLAINGEDSFFILSDGVNPNYRYTRNGNFDFDAAGNLVNLSSGFKVLGWNAERDIKTNQLIKDSSGMTIVNDTGPLEGIKRVNGDIMPGKPTSEISFNGDLRSKHTLPISSQELSFTKYVSSLVPVAKEQGGIKISESWDKAGFYKTPDGTITINGAIFKIGGGGFNTPADLMNAVNLSAAANVTMTYKDNKFTISPDSPGASISLAETPDTHGHGFFTQIFVKAGTEGEPYIYNTSPKIELQFERIFSPTQPDNNYFRWKAVDPTTTQLLSTNSYHYVKGDILQGTGAIEPEEIIGQNLGIGDSTTYIFELPHPDVDPSSLQVYIKMPSGQTTILARPNWGASRSFSTYYFDDNGQTDYAGRKNTLWPGYSPSGTGVDRIVFNGAPAAGARISVDYKRNGLNLHNSTVEPSKLHVSVNDKEISGANYKFNNNQGKNGTDQLVFYSATSTDEVVLNVLDVDKRIASAGFNWNIPVSGVSINRLLSSAVSFRWLGKEWSSARLSTYRSLGEFLAAINNGTSGVVSITYDVAADRFKMVNTRSVSIAQSNAAGFFSVAKLKGEGTSVTSPISGHSYITISAGENPISREDVVKNNLDLTLPVDKAGFNNVPVSLSSMVSFSWVIGKRSDGTYSWASWRSKALGEYSCVEAFIDDVNFATDVRGTGMHLPSILRYDPERDRFTLVNTSRADWPVMVKQEVLDPKNGFLSRVHLLTDGLAAVSIPTSVIKPKDVVSADYYYNKTVDAKGILQLDKNGKVIDSFIDTEDSPGIISSSKILGRGTLNLEGGWGQFDSGSVDGTIAITSRSGSYRSRDINSANYPTIFALLQEINTSEAKVILTYNPEVDKFTLKSAVEGDEIELKETGLHPFWTAVNITTGKIIGGNNNNVMDLGVELPMPKDGWKDTTNLYGTGQDYFKLNIAPNLIRGESLGIGGQGDLGNQVMHETITSNLSSLLSMANSDIDPATITIYRLPTTAGDMPVTIGSSSWIFLDNAGPGGRDLVLLKEGVTPMLNTYQVSYSRRNAFDLDHPDVDENTLTVKVDGRILSKEDYTFQKGRGTNGVDRILIQPHASITNPGTIGTGKITADYRLTFTESVDVFIPNGNKGPESITFIPNSPTGGTPVYLSGATAAMADKGSPVTAELIDAALSEKSYLYKSPAIFYDAFGNEYRGSVEFERIKNNLWLWTVRNPVETEKIAGYGLLAFKGNGAFDSENSKVFESPSDPLPSGSRFKGIYFDPPKTPTPPESGGAPPPSQGANPSKIVVNFDQVVQLSTTPNSTAKIASQDGYAIGKIVESETTIDATGSVIAKYTNGQTQRIGQIALARFDNPSGLSKLDGTTFTETVNSGAAQIGRPGEVGRGIIRPGELENSNVDLVQEFADMIIAQRAFQANARMVTTSEQMFIDIIALKRL